MNSDFKDLLSIFNAHGVEYWMVGAFALADVDWLENPGNRDS